MVTKPVACNVSREPEETWRQVIVRKAEPFDQVQPCLTAYQALLSEFTDPDDDVQADAAWDALLLGGCLMGAEAA
ncbi:MAG: hypothetical protein ACRYG8_31650 [Janthinobacterium lividum]